MTAARRVLVVALCAAACAGCLRRAERRQDTGPPVDYVRRRFESSLAGCDDGQGAPASCVRLQIEYVEATRATVELARAVTGFVAASVLRPVGEVAQPTSVEELRDDLYAAYREIQQNAPDYRVRWEVRRQITVACNTPRVQGLVASEHTFTGGTRPIDRIRYQTFDTQTGARVGLEALVAPEQREALLAELAQRRRGAGEAGGTAGRGGLWARGADISDGGATPPDTVLICPDALRFRWNEGGGAEVVVARDEIRPLLRTDAP